MRVANTSDNVEWQGPERRLGAKVRELRRERGWSQEDLARRLDAFGYQMHQTTVAKLEAGERPIRVNELAALAVILEVTAAELIADLSLVPPDVARLEKTLRNLEKTYADLHSEVLSVVAEMAAAEARAAVLREKVPEFERLRDQVARQLAEARVAFREAVSNGQRR